MGGWYDPFLPTQIRDFQTIRREADPRVALGTRLIVGPWMHADAVRFPDGSSRKSLPASEPRSEHSVVRSSPAGECRSPIRWLRRSELYVMGENVWRGEPEWPLARTRYTPFYLRSAGRANSGAGDGRLTRDAPSAPEPADAYVYDPRNPVPSRGGAMLGARAGIALQNDIEKRADVLVYTGESLEQDVEVTGPTQRRSPRRHRRRQHRLHRQAGRRPS